MPNRINNGKSQANYVSTLKESIRLAKMKYFVILFIAVVCFGTTFGSAPAAPIATKEGCSLKSLNPLLFGISNVLDGALRGLFETVTRLLLTVLDGLTGLIAKLVPEGKTIPLDDLKSVINELDNPNVILVLNAVLSSVDVNAVIVLKLVPGCIAHAPVDVNALLRILGGFASSTDIQIFIFLKAIVAYIIEIYAPRF